MSKIMSFHHTNSGSWMHDKCDLLWEQLGDQSEMLIPAVVATQGAKNSRHHCDALPKSQQHQDKISGRNLTQCCIKGVGESQLVMYSYSKFRV